MRLQPRSLLTSPWSPAWLVFVVYGLWLFSANRHGYDPRFFIHAGRAFILRGHGSAVISRDPYFHRLSRQSAGYDGQFAYYIAVDPLHAASYLDSPVRRYPRILYPMAARLLAVGSVRLVPYTLLLINWLAAAGGTLALAAWLRRMQVSPWLALVYGLFPGLFIGLQRDLTEPLCYAFVALAIYLFSFGGQHRLILSGVCFALACLGRETALLFAIPYGLSLLSGIRIEEQESHIRRSWIAALLFLPVAAAVAVAYHFLLLSRLPEKNVPLTSVPALLPFQGIWSYYPWSPEHINEIVSVVFPGMICIAMGLWALLRRSWSAQIWALLVNATVLVVLLPRESYVEYAGSSRLSLAVVLAAVCAVPALDRVTNRGRTWLWLAIVLWFLPWYALGHILYDGA